MSVFLSPFRSLLSSSWLNPSSLGMSALSLQLRGAKLAKARNLIRTWKIKPGDLVEVLSGKDKGSQGKVLATDYRRNMLRVQGCNLRRIRKEGETVYVEKKLHYSNVNLIDPVYKKPTRIDLKFTEDGEMIRISKRSGAVIPLPELTDKDRKKRFLDFSEWKDGPKDTPPEVALEKTYDYEQDVQTLKLLRQTLSKYNHDLH